MKRIISIVLLFSFFVCEAQNQNPVTPESLGISSQAVLNFIEAVEKERPNDLHSFILMRHGQVAAQGWWNPFQPESPHMLFSLSKSFTSTAIGIAQAEGLLNINDKVLSFFPDQAPGSPSNNMQAMRIRDLLTMTTGHNEDATGGMRRDTVNWVKGFFALPVEHKPGTHFVYNSAATFMLSAIIQKVTGKKLIEYLTPRVFEPLGIQNPTWEDSPEGINVGGWGLKVRTKDIASLGQLYLQKGSWQGKQLVPAEWVQQATSKQTSNGSNPESDWEQGYGYQFWMCRHGLYRGDGAFGQYCIVFPEQDAVLAMTSGTANMGAIMNLVWKHLLPEFKEKPLAENMQMFTALQNKTSSLTLPTVSGKPTAKQAAAISNQTYSLSKNADGLTSISFDLKSKNPSMTFAMNDKTFNIPIGIGTIKNGTYPTPAGEETPVASSAGWIAPDTLQVRLWLSETPFSFTYNVAFNKNEVNIVRTSHVNMGPATKLEMVGTRVQKPKR